MRTSKNESVLSLFEGLTPRQARRFKSRIIPTLQALRREIEQEEAQAEQADNKQGNNKQRLYNGTMQSENQ